MKSLLENVQNITTCCDIIIPNFREMDQIREQRKYLPDRQQNWYLLWRQIPILVSVQQVVPLFPNLVHFPKIGDNDVTAGGKIFNIFKK